jgi:PAS domain S-box-containing protein
MVMAVGVGVIASWALEIQYLINLFPGSAYMKPNTAVAFIFSGCGLFLLQSPGKWPRRLAQLCALAVGLIALLTLVQYASGWDLGIDELLFRVTDPAMMKSHPGRMSLQATCSFGLTAAALWLMSRPSRNAYRRMILGGIGLLMDALGLFSVFGYSILVVTGYGRGNLGGMAVHTAALFVLIGAVVLGSFLRESDGRWLIGRKLSASFGFGLVLMLAFAAYSQRSTEQLVTAAARVAHTHEVIGKIYEIKGDFEEVREGVRGFVITGDEDFLVFTNRSLPETSEDLQQLRQLTADNVAQQATFAVLESAIAASIEHSLQVIAARRDRGFEAAAQMVASGRGLDLSGRVRTLLLEMEASEAQLLVLREADSAAISKRTLLVLPFGVFVSVLILTFGIIRLNLEASNRQHVSMALERSEMKLRFALDSARIGEWELDLDTRRVSRHSAMHDQIFGYAEMQPEWTYEIFMHHLHPEDRARVDQFFHDSLASGIAVPFESRIIRHDGSDGWIWVSGNFEKDSNGKLIKMSGLVGDITERKQAAKILRESEERLQKAIAAESLANERQLAAEEIGRLNATLEQRVLDRTAQLQVAVDELDAFSYSVSHDLRAPLRAIDGFSRMIVEDYAARLDDEGRRMFGVIRNETQRMSHLIDDLLAFSRIGRQPVAPETIDMQAMAQEVFDELAAMAPDRKLKLELRPLPPAIGTPSMIRQAWINLLNNAIKFTRERDPGVIEVGAQEGADGVPIYYVKDNGVGFDMRHAEKLFGVFERLHSDAGYEGTGIGLSLVKRIIQRHGGRIWADAEVGRGATFYFTMSKTREVPPSAPPPSPAQLPIPSV